MEPWYPVDYQALLDFAVFSLAFQLEQIQLQLCMSFVSIRLGLRSHENLVAFVPGAYRYFGEHISGPLHCRVAQPYRRRDDCGWNDCWTQKKDYEEGQERPEARRDEKAKSYGRENRREKDSQAEGHKRLRNERSVVSIIAMQSRRVVISI